MATTAIGSSGVTFPDATTQATAGLTTQYVKAWVNFNGSNGAIRGSVGISSVTRTGTGAYTIAYSITFADTNYTWAFNGIRQSGTGGQVTPVVANTSTPTTTGMAIQAFNSTASSTEDYVQVVCTWFR
jgi:hypothetical protein